MLVRDTLGIVVQHSIYEPGYADSGDSSRSEGILALCDSKEDVGLLEKFEVRPGILSRHPIDYDPNSFTRDQLLPLMAGFWRVKRFDIARRVFWSHAQRFFLCQNTHELDGKKKEWWNRDILSPGNVAHLILCSRLWYLYFFIPIGWIWMFGELIWTTKVRPWSEQNQFISMMFVAGKYWLKIYTKLHPDWKKGIRIYWSEGKGFWRNQPEIGELLISSVEKKIY